MQKIYQKTTAIWIVVLAMLAVGARLGLKAPIALYPSASKPSINCGISHPGISSEQFRQLYGDLIESALMRHQDIDQVESQYDKSSVHYSVAFDWGTNAEDANAELRKILSGFESRFPRAWGQFWSWSDGKNSSRIVFSLHSATVPQTEWGKTFRETHLAQFQNIPGVTEVFLSRYDKQSILIEMIPDKLAAFSLTPKDVELALRASEFNSALGQWSPENAQPATVMMLNTLASVDDLRNLPIKSSSSAITRLADIADVKIEPDLNNEVARRGGNYVAFFGASIESDANLAAVASEVKSRLDKIIATDYPHLQASAFLDPTMMISDSITDVVIAVIFGIISATAIVYLFLKMLSTTMIIGMSIPLSMMGGLILMSLFKIDINLISVGAMAIASGMVVDGAIVIMENIARHMSRQKMVGSATEKSSALRVIYQATQEVQGSLLASLLTTIIVFLPLPFTSPIASAILGDLAIVIISVLVVSIVVTIVIIPTLTYWGIQKGLLQFASEKAAAGNNPTFFFILANGYGKMLTYLGSTKKRIIVLSLALIALFAGADYMLWDLKREIIGQPDSNILITHIQFLDPTLTQEKTIALLDELEKKMEGLLDSRVASWLQQTQRWESQAGNFFMILKESRDFDAMKAMLEAKFPSTDTYNVQHYNWNLTSLKIPDPSQLMLQVGGKNHEQMLTDLEAISKALRGMEIFSRVEVLPYTNKRKVFEISAPMEQWSRLAAVSDHQITKSGLSDYLSFAFERKLVREFNLDDELVKVELRLAEKHVQTKEDLENLPFSIKHKKIPLKALAQVDTKWENENRFRKNGLDTYQLMAWVKDNQKGMKEEQLQALVRAEIQKNEASKAAMSWLFLPAGQEISQNIASLSQALVLSLALIFIVLIFQFHSLTQVAIIMSAIPLGVIGAATALFMADSVLSVNSMLGLILLSGTAVNNSILLCDFFNRFRAEQPYENPLAVAVASAKARMRPILMTTLTTVIGMIPIAFGFGAGGEVLQPLGLAVAGGLGISTILVLIFVPIALAITAGKASQTSEKIFT